MKPEVEIYDTTLRDGSQGEGINFSLMDKLRITEAGPFSVHYRRGVAARTPKTRVLQAGHRAQWSPRDRRLQHDPAQKAVEG
jgi:hypothetical protein